MALLESGPGPDTHMKIKAEALPGTRDSILEDAFCVACSTRAVIEFQFNSETVEVEAPFSLDLGGYRGFARFRDAEGNVTARFERLTHIRRNPIWWPVPNASEPGHEASPEAK